MAEPPPALGFEGHGSGAEHRTTGTRAWCFECKEWCYPEYPCGSQSCCAEKKPDQPRSWALPPEPGPEVTRLRCECHGFRWQLRYAPPAARWEPDIGRPSPESSLVPWRWLLHHHEKLIDATGDPK